MKPSKTPGWVTDAESVFEKVEAEWKAVSVEANRAFDDMRRAQVMAESVSRVWSVTVDSDDPDSGVVCEYLMRTHRDTDIVVVNLRLKHENLSIKSLNMGKQVKGLQDDVRNLRIYMNNRYDEWLDAEGGLSFRGFVVNELAAQRMTDPDLSVRRACSRMLALFDPEE